MIKVAECINYGEASGTNANDVNTLFELMNAVDPSLSPEAVQVPYTCMYVCTYVCIYCMSLKNIYIYIVCMPCMYVCIYVYMFV